MSHTFKADIEIIGINPFVFVPEKILEAIFKQAGKDKGAIPIKGRINEMPYRQTLVKFRGAWRLYINTGMLKKSPERIGETIELTIEFDPSDRSIKPHPEFVKALNENKKAKTVFEGLRPSLKHEIVRYIANLKTEESINRNVVKAIEFLLGKARFVGRDKP
ncbi:MAG: YdeI/OmpD-associated family protein [Cytophagaceae bacterium]